ncbi:MAG: AAA family ATPase [Anaerolineae bacterium]|nr:AAA family ATPase [Anaerolineae bacterium]
MRRLSLSCLGPFQVTLDGQPVTTFKSVKVRALLAYLAVEADRPHPREVLAGLLWPDWPDRDALGNLRYTLSDLRRAIGDRDTAPPFLLITRDTLQFNVASDCWLDVTAFLELTAAQDLPEMEEGVSLYRGSFLEGFSVGDSAPFEEWALLTRERLARQISSALHHLAAGYEQRGEYTKAESFARRQIELEPWDEKAHQQLMRALALSGRRSAALAQYETCCRLLADELGVEPAAETTTLYERIRGGELTRRLSSPPDLPGALPLFLEAQPHRVERPIFVARECELAQLDRYLDLVLAGQGSVVFVTGEAGSGKTALIQEFTHRALEAHPSPAEGHPVPGAAGGEHALVVATGNCNAYTGIGDPYLPFREILALLTGDVEARWAAGAMTGEHARRLWNTLPYTAQALVDAGPDLLDTFLLRPALLDRALAFSQASGGLGWLPHLKELVECKPPPSPSPQQSDLFNQYTRVLQAMAQQVPLLLVVDDLQWADLGSISLLFHLGKHLAGCRILVVGAYRPEEVAFGRDGVRHPLEPVVNEFQRDLGAIIVDLARTEGRTFVRALLDSEPNTLGPSFREMLYRQTRGHPLFTIELLRGLQERGDLVHDQAGRWLEGPALDWQTLPARVEAAIRERIDRLAAPLRDALRAASVEGEVFTAEVVARVRGIDEREMRERLSGELDRRHRLVRAQTIERLGPRRLSRYRFRNYLFQHYLYDSLDPVERSCLHEDVGNMLEEIYAGEANDTAAIAPQLAWHFQEAGIAEKAVHYLRQAGERAVQVSAYQEGIGHLTAALSELMSLPASAERDRQELGLQLLLGIARISHGTFSQEVETAYARARELGHRTGETALLCQALGEMAIFHYVRAEHHQARALAQEALGEAERAGDPVLVAWHHWHLGFVLFCLAQYTPALDHLQRVIGFYRPAGHQSFAQLPGADASLSAMAYAACCLWSLGYPDQATQMSRQAVVLARKAGHLFSLGDVLCYAGCTLHTMLRDGQAVKEHAEALLQLADKARTWLAPAIWHRGAALAMMGQVDEGLAQMGEGMAEHKIVGKRCYLPVVLACIAEAQGAAGRPDVGLRTLAEALSLVKETDERHWEPELHRLRAELLLMQGSEVEAEASLHTAIEIARRQRARSWELRATTGLARLWQAQGRVDDARQALADIYGWFTEGFDTTDLVEARTLLEELP